MKQNRLWLSRFRSVSEATKTLNRSAVLRVPGSGNLMRFTVWSLPLLFAVIGVFNSVGPVAALTAGHGQVSFISWLLFWIAAPLLLYLLVAPWSFGLWMTPNHVVIRSWWRVHRIPVENVQGVHTREYDGLLIQFVALFRTAMIVLELKDLNSGGSRMKAFPGTLSGIAQTSLNSFAIERWLNRTA